MKCAKLEKNRIEAISDGIYAIAMTLAVLSIDVDAQLPTHESLLEALPGMLMQLRHYIVSFVTLAAFWIGQHYLMDRIKKTDTLLNWIVLSHLLFIAIIPATIGVIGNFDSVLAVRIFVINIFMISLTIVIEHAYVRRHEELGVDDQLKKSVPFGFLILPGYSVLVFFLAIPLEDWATLFYVMLPVLRRKLT
jgi:uncharacterized membrane protein